jgi:hypothetical protein
VACAQGAWATAPPTVRKSDVTSPATTVTDAQGRVVSGLRSAPAHHVRPARGPRGREGCRSLYDTSHAVMDDAILYAQAGDGTSSAKLGDLARHLHDLGNAIWAPAFGLRRNPQMIHEGRTRHR